MKVLQIVEPGKDGVFVHVNGLINYLRRNGISVDLFYSTKRSSNGLTQIIEELRDDVRCCLYDMQVGPHPTFRDILVAFRILQYILLKKPDIIHLHSSKAGAIGRISSLFFDPDRIFYTPNAYYGMGARPKRFGWFFRIVEKLLRNRAITINVSFDEQEWAMKNIKLPLERSLVIPNGVSTIRFAPVEKLERSLQKEKYGFRSDDIVIGSVGRLCEQKNPMLLLKAFDKITKNHCKCRLLYIGDGELVKEFQWYVIKNNLSDKIVLVKQMDDLRSFYSAIDVFALTSRYEGLSISLIEALASGCPAVITDVPGNREMVRFGFNQILYARSNHVDDLVEKMSVSLKFITSGKSNNHYDIVNKKLSSEVVYKRILEEYRKSQI
jgi:glycosyltransferase involved in cell wall biosynthesis